MKEVKFEHMKIINFCGIKQLEISLHDRTVVKGRNAVGKSTVKKAIQYVLNVRDENGKEISGIRPHDENGIDIDGLVTSVELTVSVDGAENALRKDFYQKKNRKGEYTGEDATEYFIDDVKKGTKKAYDEYVATLIPNEVCINASTLLEKDTTGRRAMLSVFSKHTSDGIIAENPHFQQIAGKVKANSVTDLKKALREKINGSKNKSGLNDDLKRIGIQIEVEESKKRDIDFVEMELQRNSIKDQIAEIEVKEADISKQFEEYQKLSDGVLELKLAVSDLKRKANEENNKKKHELDYEIVVTDERAIELENQIKRDELYISSSSHNCETFSKQIEVLRKDYTDTQSLEFDENNLICSYCGQEYPAEKKDQLRAEFEDKKAQRLSDIAKDGKDLNDIIEAQEKKRRECRKQIEENKIQLNELKEKLKKLDSERSNLPVFIDISDTKEYKDIQSQIAEKESAMKKMNNVNALRKKLKDKKSELHSQLAEVNTQIALSEENIKIDERIAELQKKQRDVSQQIADVECELDLLKDYERKTAEALERDVNEYFEFATVKMFDTYQNGDIKDICIFTHKGTSYDNNLNHGARILTEIDICKAFQKLYEVECPIIIEDTESLDNDKIPNAGSQIIMLKRTDDEKLTIEEAR